MSKRNSWLMYWKWKEIFTLWSSKKERKARDFWHANQHKELFDN